MVGNVVLVAVNLVLSALVIFGAVRTLLASAGRPRVAATAVHTLMLATVYFAIFAHRLTQPGAVRPPGWLGDLGTVAAPLAFYWIWYKPLDMIRQHLTDVDVLDTTIRRVEHRLDDLE